MVANGNQTPPFSPIILDLQEFELQILFRHPQALGSVRNSGSAPLNDHPRQFARHTGDDVELDIHDFARL
jgi:hypothetical protein